MNSAILYVESVRYRKIDSGIIGADGKEGQAEERQQSLAERWCEAGALNTRLSSLSYAHSRVHTVATRQMLAEPDRTSYIVAHESIYHDYPP